MSKRPNRKKGIYVRLLDNISSNYGEKQDASYISCKKCVWYIVLWTYPKNQTMNKMKHWKLTWFNIFLFIHSLWSVILEWCGELQENWIARIILIHNIKYLQKLTISLFFFLIYLDFCFRKGTFSVDAILRDQHEKCFCRVWEIRWYFFYCWEMDVQRQWWSTIRVCGTKNTP